MSPDTVEKVPPQGPEDALDPDSIGDYTDRLKTGPRMTTRVIPEEEREKRAKARAGGDLTFEAALEDEPRFEEVPATDDDLVESPATESEPIGEAVPEEDAKPAKRARKAAA